MICTTWLRTAALEGHQMATLRPLSLLTCDRHLAVLCITRRTVRYAYQTACGFAHVASSSQPLTYTISFLSVGTCSGLIGACISRPVYSYVRRWELQLPIALLLEDLSTRTDESSSALVYDAVKLERARLTMVQRQTVLIRTHTASHFLTAGRAYLAEVMLRIGSAGDAIQCCRSIKHEEEGIVNEE
jgi:hypothetical protein